MRRKTHEKIVNELLRAHARDREEWLRERRDLLDRIMLMADRPWGLPPSPPEEPQLPSADPVVWPELLQPEEAL